MKQPIVVGLKILLLNIGIGIGVAIIYFSATPNYRRPPTQPPPPETSPAELKADRNEVLSDLTIGKTAVLENSIFGFKQTLPSTAQFKEEFQSREFFHGGWGRGYRLELPGATLRVVPSEEPCACEEGKENGRAVRVNGIRFCRFERDQAGAGHSWREVDYCTDNQVYSYVFNTRGDSKVLEDNILSGFELTPAPRVTRKEGLQIRLRNGDVFDVRNSSTNYQYRGFIPGYHVIAEKGEHGQSYFLVNDNNGRIFPIDSDPAVSPDKKYFATGTSDEIYLNRLEPAGIFYRTIYKIRRLFSFPHSRDNLIQAWYLEMSRTIAHETPFARLNYKATRILSAAKRVRGRIQVWRLNEKDLELEAQYEDPKRGFGEPFWNTTTSFGIWEQESPPHGNKYRCLVKFEDAHWQLSAW